MAEALKIRRKDEENMGGLFLSPLAKALKGFCAPGYYREDAYAPLAAELQKLYGKPVNEVKTVEEFLHKKFVKAIAELVGKDYCAEICEMVRIRARGQFSTSVYRRAFHSSDFGYYAAPMVNRIRCWIHLSFYDHTREEMLRLDTSYVSGFSDVVALEISRRNPVFLSTIEEMILGDNSTALLSRSVIQGILQADDEHLKDLLLQLLLAAKGQEGLRQAILESADIGDLNTFKKIFSFCVENDLFRFSSAARALYTWCGLYHEETDIAFTRKMANTAWQCLTQPERRQEYLASANPYEMYLALWAKGCEEVREIDSMLDTLLQAGERYKKYLGWYFVRGVENERYRHNKATAYLEEEDIGVIACVTDELHVNRNACHFYTSLKADYQARTCPDPIYPADAGKRKELFYRLKPIAERIGSREWKIDGYLFPWSRLVINQKNAEVLRCMFSLAAYDLDDELVDELYRLRDLMDSDLRKCFYVRFLRPDTSSKHRAYLYDGLKDKSLNNREAAIEKLKNCRPITEDIDRVCTALASRSSSLKKCVLGYLKALPEADQDYAVSLLVEGSENELQAACELLLGREDLREKYRGALAARKETGLSDQTLVLLNQVAGSREEAAETGDGKKFGLFSEVAVQQAVADLGRQYPREFLSEKQLLAMLPSQREVMELVEQVRQVFLRHADYEYEIENPDGSRERVLFGDDASTYYAPLRFPAQYGPGYKLKQDGTARLAMVPFCEEFRAVLKDFLAEPAKTAMLCYAIQRFGDPDRIEDWYQPFTSKFRSTLLDECHTHYGRSAQKYLELIELSLKEVDPDAAYEALSRMYFGLCHLLGEEKLSQQAIKPGRYAYQEGSMAGDTSIFINLAFLIQSLDLSPASRRDWFRSKYYLERSQNYAHSASLGLPAYLDAVDRKLIPVDCLYDWLLQPKFSRNGYTIKLLTSPNAIRTREYARQYPWLADAVKEFADKAVRYEAKRGQAPTEISGHVKNIYRFEGKEYFVLLLQALGDDTLFRGYIWSGDNTKSSILSLLLRCCWPAPGDDAAGLKALLARTGIKEKRLIEAAMYAPQWSGLIEQVIGWEGLKKAVWFFQAHISEHFSADKETEVALYSPISPQRFNDGAFDVEWFRDIYAQMGEKRFKQLYDCAKYLTSGSNAHRRSQLYADAVRGKLDPQALEAEIRDKRNQEKLRAYGLLPVTEAELLHRYLFINEYIKESRQFGAQRRESEKKAGAVALENLSIASGYFDVNRMLWKLEGEKSKEILPLLEKKTVEGCELSLAINEKGEAELCIEKNGKAIKTAPKALAKNEYLELLKTTAKEIKEQRLRGLRTLEDAMVNRTVFTAAEIKNLLSSLAIAPSAKDLLWKCGSSIGYLRGDASGIRLADWRGEVQEIRETDELILAHPHHLLQAGCWADFMHEAYARQLVQPFKQIFREYYPLTDEEKEERTVTRRYAGYQVQSQRTVALLKGRGWTVDYEEGLQKVFYGDDLLVRLYAQADWFSPADIEAPTLEEIQICSRRSGEALPLESVDPIVFSEIMRDIDLVVSVAYVGGVDAETSHSTVEMRAAIAKELTQLMKLKNVEFTDRHARIHGTLADYSVHLGSGIVHAEEKGMIPILPVHSQHRGRIFLPFADEDPKTAEILSKIILLAEDTKIKDPEILKLLR